MSVQSYYAADGLQRRPHGIQATTLHVVDVLLIDNVFDVNTIQDSQDGGFLGSFLKSKLTATSKLPLVSESAFRCLYFSEPKYTKIRLTVAQRRSIFQFTFRLNPGDAIQLLEQLKMPSKTHYVFDKWFRDYVQDHGKGAVYDYTQSQLDQYGEDLKTGDIVFVVYYADKTNPVSTRKIKVSKFKITRVEQRPKKKCGVIFGKRIGETRVFNRGQFAKEYRFMLNRNEHFLRRAFHNPY